MKHVFIFGIVTLAHLFECFPYDSPVVSKYAKVSVWNNNGSNHEDINKRRLMNHRLDPKSISSTKKQNPSVAYQYPVYQHDHKIDIQPTEHIPGIGEVIVAQDRFEARPLFAYKKKLSQTYGPAKSEPPPTYAPVATTSVASSAVPIPSSNLYSSPYSSYNPPDFKQSYDSFNIYPPHEPAPTVDVSSTESSKGSTPDSYASLGPPIAPDYDNNEGQEDKIPPYQQNYNDQAEDPMSLYKNNENDHNHDQDHDHHDHEPPHPPKSIDDVYYPPDFPEDQIKHDEMMMPPKNMDGGNQAAGDAADMNPPPPPQFHNFPSYLYDQHDHHVYEEVPHTTMAPAKEDKRVSSTNYSYYYLGRKLWYIPLYFSIYFILYVTVLILKSIARHKVKLKYKWYEHDSSAREKGRSLDLKSINQEEVNDAHWNVSIALKNATAKYNDKIMNM